MKPYRGFTLIELIIGITIILLLTGLALTNYGRYNEQEKVKQVASQFAGDMRMAQTNALSGNKPISCGSSEFLGYEISFTQTSYTMTPRCASGLVTEEETVITFPSGVTFTETPSTFLFYPLARGTSLPTDTIVSFTGNAFTKTLTIASQSGVITQ